MIYEAIANYFMALSIALIRKLISAVAVCFCNVRYPFPDSHTEGSDYNLIRLHAFKLYYNIVILYSLYQIPSNASVPSSASSNGEQPMPVEDDWKEISSLPSETMLRVLMGRTECSFN